MIGLEPGSLFAGRYEVIRRIGAGGMGAVYLACDPSDREFKVALKLLYPGTIQSNQARDRFRNEITASYRVNHNNVVRAYEYFDAEDVQAYAMEFVDGGDLMERMREGAMSPEETCKVLRQMAAALEAVHKAGIIHRDLKPENILLTRKGEVKLSDFGVARLKGGHTLTQAGSMVGTPKYLAPEYVETGECDGRGDLFAVGVIGYELIAGVSPFGKDFKSNNVLDRLTMEIAPLHKAVPGCPADLSQIIAKAMSMQLSGRYQSAADLRADLERFERGEPLGFAPIEDEEDDWDSPKMLVSKQNTAEVPSWDCSDKSESEQPLVNSTQGFLSAHLKDIVPGPQKKRKVPLFAAIFSLCFMLVALGFTSAILLRKPNPLQGLQEGVYTGVVTGLGGAQIPLGVWAFPNHALALLGVDGCAAGALPRDGTYQCGEKVFRFTVNSVSPEGASGSISVPGSAESGTWVISKPPAPKQEQAPAPPASAEHQRLVPAAASHVTANQVVVPAVSAPVNAPEVTASQPVAAAKEPTNIDTARLQEIEQKLKEGKLTPEEAARALLSMTEQSSGGSK